MALTYSSSSRALQDTFDTRRLAERLAEVKVHDRFTGDDREFIERMDMFFLATVDATGQPTCSYKGGDPGFVTILDDSSLAFPSYDGNGMYLSMGNLMETQAVGMLFIDFSAQRRLRVEGAARLSTDDPLIGQYLEAQFVVRVKATRIYPNCPRYIHKYELVQRSHTFRDRRHQHQSPRGNKHPGPLMCCRHEIPQLSSHLRGLRILDSPVAASSVVARA